MKNFKNLTTGIFTLFVLGLATIASASPGFNITGSTITFTAGPVIKLISPQVGSFKNDGKISIIVEASNLSGPLYVYLLDPTTRRVVATDHFDRTMFLGPSRKTVDFDLSKYKSGLSITPGKYKIVLCDTENRITGSVCAYSGDIDIISSPPQLSGISSTNIFPGISYEIYGSGFDSNSYILVDGGWNSLVTLKNVSDDSASITFLPGIQYGNHNITIASRTWPFVLSKQIGVSINMPRSPIISSFEKKGNIFVITGSGMSRAYPSEVEIIRNNKVTVKINPSKENAFAISEDGTSMRFLWPKDLDQHSDVFVRVSNGEYYKSNISRLVVTQ